MDLVIRLAFVFFLPFQFIIGSPQRLLLISFDGFRYDYLNYYSLGNFTKFAENGVRASKGMYPVFPTKTFPNHYALVTGLYPESNGIVDNNFYDPDLRETFNMTGSFESKWFDQAEPIWISARLQGRKSGVFAWPGSTVTIRGKVANEYTLFNDTIPFSDRVDTVVEWFTKKNLSFVALYFEQPDGMGHEFGAFSDQVTSMVKTMDDVLGYIINQFTKHNLIDTTDIIIVSDHGMTNISFSSDDSLFLDNYLSEDDAISIPQIGPEGSVYPQEGKVMSVYNKLKNKHPRVDVYLKEDLPERFHFKRNNRIAPIILIANENFTIARNAENLQHFSIGQHGYDNQLNSMKPIFLASGPSFKRGSNINTFENVNIYPLMCYILNIEPKANNGSLDVFKDVLTSTTSSATTTTNNSLIYLMLVVTLALIFVQSQ